MSSSYTKLVIVCILVICSSTISRAEFITTYSINSKTIEKIENWVDKDTIIFIELDDVLTMPESKMFSYDSNPYRMFINNLLTMGKKTPAYNRAIANWYGQRKIKLIEEGWIDFFQRMREKGAKIYGLCTMPLHLTNIEQKRLKEIIDLGILFNGEINNANGIIIKKQSSWGSRFDNGIIYTGPYPKSKTILELMKVTNLSPKKMLIFGSIKHEVKSIDKALRRFNMYFKSILYLGARQIKGKPDPEIVKFQQKELINKGLWYEDSQAEELLNFRRQKKSN